MSAARLHPEPRRRDDSRAGLLMRMRVSAMCTLYIAVRGVCAAWLLQPYEHMLCLIYICRVSDALRVITTCEPVVKTYILLEERSPFKKLQTNCKTAFLLVCPQRQPFTDVHFFSKLPNFIKLAAVL